jgi:hypothetical protein
MFSGVKMCGFFLKKLTTITLFFCILLLVACKYTTPPEMLMGNWYVASVKANGHEMINDYLDVNTRYLIFNEEGSYQVGLLDSTNDKNWMINPDRNELIMLHGSPFDGIKTWGVKASDELIYLTDKHNHLTITLNRRDKLPKLEIIEETALFGKWVIDKITVDGYDNTDKYAFPDRWILLADNGRFYNGNEPGDHNVGYWKTNSSLTKLDFFAQKNQEEPFITFNIANSSIWYEKQNDDRKNLRVRVYFKKSN